MADRDGAAPSGGARILAGGDFHLGPLCHAFERCLAGDVLPIFLGDLVNRPREDAGAFHALVARWAEANPDLVVVPGNHDPADAGPWEGVRVHERRGLTILALPVIPILYKIPSWTHEHSEATIARMVEPFRGGTFDVVASHAPPWGVLDRVLGGRHVGSRALLDLAHEIDFGIWLCGHAHEGSGRESRIDGRPVVNAARTIVERTAPVVVRRPRAERASARPRE